MIEGTDSYLDRAREMARLGDRVTDRAPDTPPASGELTTTQVERASGLLADQFGGSTSRQRCAASVQPKCKAPEARLRRRRVGVDWRVDYDILIKVLTALEARVVRYAIFGAVALNMHGLARFTEDPDLFVAADRENILRERFGIEEP